MSKQKMQEIFDSYTIETWYSKNDMAYLAQIQELPDCITDGKTRMEAIEELELVFEGWLEIALEDGITIPSANKYGNVA